MLKTRYIDSIISTLSEDEVVFANKLIEQPDSKIVKNEYKSWINKSEKKNVIPEIEELICKFNLDDCTDKESIIADVLSCQLLYGVSPLEYFQFEFQNKSDLGRNEYFCDAEKFIAFRPAYDFSKYELVRNKWNQYTTLKDLFARGCVLCVSDSADSSKEKFVEFVKKHPTFVFKPLRASCGNGVRIIDSRNLNITEEQLFKTLSEENGIADQQIVQDERMECLHPGSVNTIRLVAVRDRKNKKNYYTQSLLRMGRGNGIVDNNTEAIRSRIDIDAGITYTPGVDGYGNQFTFHPDSKAQIIGFSVPKWPELIKVADCALERIENYARYIGFDFALSEEGVWKIIEINPFPQIFAQQITTRKGSREEMIALAKKCE